MSGTSLPELLDLYKLTEEENKIVQSNIIEALAGRSKPSTDPKIIILGAQPGAGKTQMEKLAIYEQRNLVICNVDNLRDFHPFAGEIKKNHEKQYPDITTAFTHKWAIALQDFCRQNKISYLLETTFQNGEGVDNILKRGKKEGFSTEIKLLAVNGKMSFLGTELRYESMVKEEGYGRIVGKIAHDLRYNALPNALKHVTERRNYDELNLYGRDFRPDGFRQKLSLRLIAHNPEKPVSLYLKERDRPWTKSEIEYYNKSVNDVIALKQIRGASKKEIDRFKSDLDDNGNTLKSQVKKNL